MLFFLLSLSGVRGATLQDFGYQNMNVNGQLAIGHRPLLVIVGNFAGEDPLAHDVPYYDDLYFNQLRMPSVNGYYAAMSNGRFTWTRGGTIGPLSFSASETAGSFNNDLLFTSNVVWKAMASGLFNFADYDANHDGHITVDELGIVFVSNDLTGCRYAGVVTAPGGAFDWGGGTGYCNVGCIHDSTTNNGAFTVFCEEFEETLGPPDIYGVWNQECLSFRLSPQSCTMGGNNIYYLDAWNRMELGWCEPRIESLTTGGVVTISAAQSFDPTAPVILYDPARGPSEFWMLEYRTQISPSGSGYDANVAANGLAVWHIQEDVGHNPTTVPRLDAGPIPGQNNWRWCDKCQGIFFITDPKNPSLGACPAGGTHRIVDNPTDYMIVNNNPSAPGEHGWLWCDRCQTLFYGPNQASSRDPLGGQHDGSASGDYSLIVNVAGSPGQHGWRRCQKCQSMFYFPNQTASGCPAGGTHDGSASGDYAMLLYGNNLVVWNEGAPDFPRGGNSLWGSDAYTPYLKWLDGTATATRLHLRPFAAGDGAINVEWLSELDTWVDFNGNPSLPELGTFDDPYRSIAAALPNVSYGGTLHIKTGSTKERPIFATRMNIVAYNGPVTIGSH